MMMIVCKWQVLQPPIYLSIGVSRIRGVVANYLTSGIIIIIIKWNMYVNSW